MDEERLWAELEHHFKTGSPAPDLDTLSHLQLVLAYGLASNDRGQVRALLEALDQGGVPAGVDVEATRRNLSEQKARADAIANGTLSRLRKLLQPQ